MQVESTLDFHTLMADLSKKIQEGNLIEKEKLIEKAFSFIPDRAKFVNWIAKLRAKHGYLKWENSMIEVKSRVKTIANKPLVDGNNYSKCSHPTCQRLVFNCKQKVQENLQFQSRSQEELRAQLQKRLNSPRLSPEISCPDCKATYCSITCQGNDSLRHRITCSKAPNKKMSFQKIQTTIKNTFLSS